MSHSSKDEPSANRTSPDLSVPGHPEAGVGRNIEWIVLVAAGVIAAMHIWKLPGALGDIREDLGLSLVAAGALLGMVQVASMLLGLVVSLFAELIGLRRTLLIGLLLLALGSIAGALVPTAALLMITRGLEGVGFLMATVVAPALIRRLTTSSTANVALGWWGSFQGIAAFIAILASVILLTVVSWRIWWTAMAALTAAVIPVVMALVPRDQQASVTASRSEALASALTRIGRTLRTLPPWGIAFVFACYTLQWGAVIGFLPTIFTETGVDTLVAGVATALVAGLNGLGNVLTGMLLQRDVPMRPLVFSALVTMAITSTLFFAVDWAGVSGGLVWQVITAGLFSFGGAAIPASMMRLAVEVAPSGGSTASVLGVMQQIYNAANFVGPILLAAVAASIGGWHLSWIVTVTASGLGIAVSVLLLRGRVTSSLR